MDLGQPAAELFFSGNYWNCQILIDGISYSFLQSRMPEMPPVNQHRKMVGVQENHDFLFCLPFRRARDCRRSFSRILRASLNNCFIPSSSVNIPTVWFQSLDGFGLRGLVG